MRRSVKRSRKFGTCACANMNLRCTTPLQIDSAWSWNQDYEVRITLLSVNVVLYQNNELEQRIDLDALLRLSIIRSEVPSSPKFIKSLGGNVSRLQILFLNFEIYWMIKHRNHDRIWASGLVTVSPGPPGPLGTGRTSLVTF